MTQVEADDTEEEETTTSEDEEMGMDPSEALARKLMEEEERAHRERMLAYAGVSLNATQTTQGHAMLESEDISPEDDDIIERTTTRGEEVWSSSSSCFVSFSLLRVVR